MKCNSPKLEPVREIRFGIRVPPCAPVDEIAEFAVTVEKAAFDTAWFPDSQFLFRDVWTTMAMAGKRTTTLNLGTAVTNFESRHVAVTAAAIATVEELAPRRLRIGIGSGETAVKSLGLPRTSVDGMRDRFAELQALLSKQSVSFGGGGEFAGMRMRVRGVSGRHVGLYIAATGPRMLQLAGAIADGVIILAGSSPELVERAISLVQKGAESSGRRIEDIDIVLAAHTAIAADPLKAIRQVKPMILQSAHSGASEALRRIGIELNVPPRPVENVYPALGHAEDWDAAVAHASTWVSDDMAARYAEHYALVGTLDSVTKRLNEAVALGVSSFYVLDFSSYTLPHDLVKVMSEDVMPQITNRNSDRDNRT